MAKRVGSVLSLVVAVTGLLASVGPATQTVRDAVGFLWPTGMVGVLSVVSLVEAWLLWRCQRSPVAEQMTDGDGGLSEAALDNRDRAYEAMLAASEPYINAHRGAPDFSEPQDVYLPDLEEAERVIDVANENFVAARRLIEQHGSRPVFEAALSLEDAVNTGDLDQAARVRRHDLVPAIRADRNLSSHDPGRDRDDRYLTQAIDNLLDELATIHSRLTDAIERDFYSYKFFLPSAAYHKGRDVIGQRSSEAREILRDVYVQADALNDQLPGGTSDGIALEYVRTPDASQLREAVSRAQELLRDLHP
jgi:hypothetical protein